MSEQVLRNGNAMARSKTRTVTQIAMLGAIAGILMNLEFPLPFLAPTFYQLDFSEIPVLVGSFAMGPIAGVLTDRAGEDSCASGNKGIYDSSSYMLYQCIRVTSGIRKGFWNAGRSIYRNGKCSTQFCK